MVKKTFSLSRESLDDLKSLATQYTGGNQTYCLECLIASACQKPQPEPKPVHRFTKNNRYGRGRSEPFSMVGEQKEPAEQQQQAIEAK